MSVAVEKLEEQFNKLAPEEQAEALERFSRTFYGEQEESPEFLNLLSRRVAEVEAGTVIGRDAFEVLNELQTKPR